MKRRASGTGSVFWYRGRCVGEYRAWDIRAQKSKIVRIRGDFEEEIEARLAEILATPLRPVIRGTAARTGARMSRLEAIQRALVDAERNGWDRDYTARVIAASLAPERLRLGVYGPCFFCGDWLAGTVDHLNPRTRGGGDNPGNLASACETCNFRKGARTAAEFARTTA